MKFKEYKCKLCEERFEVTFKDTDDFPDIQPCPICNFDSKKMPSPVGYIMHQGKCGNQKNGYTSNKAYIKKT